MNGDNFCEVDSMKFKPRKILNVKVTHKLIIEKPKRMRYATVGDYVKRKGTWEIIVADMGNPLYAHLIHIHELIELILVEQSGIKQKDIDKFDIWFEAEKAKESPDLADYEEPGLHPDAPYHDQHKLAMTIERMVAAAAGVNWEEYNRAVDLVYEKVKKEKIGQ